MTTASVIDQDNHDGDSNDESYHPIDILFLGSHNAHREKVQRMFQKLAVEEQIRADFYFKYDTFDFVRENLIDQAKVPPCSSISSSASSVLLFHRPLPIHVR
jgi:hypothetical protein